MLIVKLKTILEILSAKALSPRKRCKFIWLKCKRKFLKDNRHYRFPVGEGFVLLDPLHSPDLGTFREVFVSGDYFTNYKGSVVVDLGAHKGYFTAYALANGADAVFAFEPEDRNFEALTTTANSFKASSCEVFLYKVAVSVVEGEIDFFITQESRSHSIYRRPDRQVFEKKKVPVTCFDYVISKAKTFAGPDRAVIVKMDIEGAEKDILLKTSLNVFLDINEMFVEFHHRYMGYFLNQLIQKLEASGLSIITRNSNGVIHFRRR